MIDTSLSCAEEPAEPAMITPLTTAQREALIRLLAKATKAGFLPSVPDTFCLLELIDGKATKEEEKYAEAIT